MNDETLQKLGYLKHLVTGKSLTAGDHLANAKDKGNRTYWQAQVDAYENVLEYIKIAEAGAKVPTPQVLWSKS